MKPHLKYALAASAALALPLGANAQVDTSTDAVAVLIKAPTVEEKAPVLEVDGIGQLVFGWLRIPSGQNPGNKCVYSLQLEAFNMRTSVQEVDDTGAVVGPNATNTDCAWTTDGETNIPDTPAYTGANFPQAGAVWLNCEEDRELTYQIQYQNAAAGVFFTAPATGRFTVTREAAVREVRNTFSDTVTCGRINADGPGEVRFNFGGKVTVSENATESANSHVGTILFEASY